MNSDERFRTVVEAAPNAMVMISADGRIEMVNVQAERLFGYPRSEMLGRPIEILLPDRLQGGHSALRRSFFDEPEARLMGAGRDLFARRKDGREFPVEIGLNPIETDQGVMVLSAIVDITERHQMMADARYLASIVESSNDAIIGKDLDGRIRSWNRAAEDILGYRAEDVIGRNIALLFPAERLAEEAAIVDKIKRGERVEHLETERLHKDGGRIPVSLTVSPIRDARGVVIGASKILRDISERRDAQRALALSEAEFRASFEGAAVGNLLAEPASRRILRANHALARLLGYQPEDIVGRTSTEFTWPEDRAADDAQYALLLSGASDAQLCEQRYIRRDGTPVWVRVSATLVRRPDTNQPSLAVIAIEDIDARYRAQADLLAAKQDLEVVVDQRTAALQQRDILLREVYHRVKNNLQIIDSLLVMQGRQLSDPGSRIVLENLRGRVFALGLVHHQLMGSANMKSFDVAPFLKELSANIIEGGAEGKIKLSVEAIPLDVGLDFAIPLGLLVTELVTNALKHAFPSGAGNVSVILERGEAGKIILIVSDDGQGQTGGETSLRPPKTGLGTGIVAGLVAQLGGTLSTQSENGTRTEIRVPEPVL